MTDFNAYLPENSQEYIQKLIAAEPINIQVVKARKSKHGDFRIDRWNKAKITMNNNLNPYRFLITLVHEIAHFHSYKKFGLKIISISDLIEYRIKGLGAKIITELN